MNRRMVLSLGVGVVAATRLSAAGPSPKAPPLTLGAARPIVAIWCVSQGFRPGPPYLRIAIWEDGRVLFAEKPDQWSDALREGKISPEEVSRLKRALGETGVFALRSAAYLVPDAPDLCMVLNIGGKRRSFHWDEVENPHYGINIEPTPEHLRFKACWKAVNQLAVVARPGKSGPVSGKFQPPRSWYLKPTTQAE